MKSQFVPHEYQQRAIQQILDLPRVGVFMDMGLGKTVTTLTAIKILRYERFQIHAVLVVAPLKVAEATWQCEIKKWEGLDILTYSSILGTPEERRRAVRKKADIYVINRDNFSWLVDELGNKWFFDMVVLDESSSFKNPKAIRFKKLRRVRKRINRIVELTGTPAARDYMDLWSQLFLLDGGQRLGRTLTQYRDVFFRPDKRNGNIVYSYKLRQESEELIQKLIGDICFSMKAKDYLTLPERIIQDVPVVLDKDARKQYEKLQAEYVLSLSEDQVIDASTAAVLRNKLLQVAGGSVYDDQKNSIILHSCKVNALLELIEQINSPVLLFYSYRHSLSVIEEELTKLGFNWAEYKTQNEADSWNERKLDVLIAHPASCAYGLNLQHGGHHIIWFGLTDSLELYQQANARLHRQGQNHPVIIHRLICQDTADEDVIAGLESKDRIQEILLERMKLRVDKIRKE